MGTISIKTLGYFLGYF